MYNHYENWIEFRKTKPGDCEANLLFHQELSLGQSADIAKVQAGLIMALSQNSHHHHENVTITVIITSLHY